MREPEITDPAHLEAGDTVWVKYPYERDEIPHNKLNRRDIEPVTILEIPTKKEERYVVQSVWRHMIFKVSMDRFISAEEMKPILEVFNN